MKAIVLILLLFFVEQLLTVVLGHGLLAAGWVGGREVAYGVASFPVQLLFIMSLAWLGLVRRRLPTDRMPMRTGSTLAALGATAALMLALGGATDLVGVDDGGTTAFFSAMKGNPICLVSLALVGPLTEEVVFREGLVRHMVRSGLNRYAAAVLAALVFALVHGNAAQGIPAFVLGTLFGVFYVTTGDLRLPVVAHVLVNTSGLVSYYLTPMSDEATGIATRLILIVSCTLAAVALLMAWQRLRLRNL